MRIGHGVHGRVGATAQGLVLRTALLAVLTTPLLLGAVGCQAQRDESKSAGGAGGESGESGEASTATTGAASQDARPASRSNHVLLTDDVCVRFEPHWTTIHAGQSLTWKSALKAPVTIHVSAGAFDKTEYVVRPGATVSTGPAQSAGTYSMWTEPAACQGVSRGAQGSGPGVTVE